LGVVVVVGFLKCFDDAAEGVAEPHHEPVLSVCRDLLAGFEKRNA
jgi:hypothetical protein